ncbi:MAG: hypothetical protein V5A25_01685 [Halovenus sp.]
MVNLPWQGEGEEDESTPDAEDDPTVTCEFQDGTLKMFDERVVIERTSRSRFEDKEIHLTEVHGVTYTKRLIISYIQIEQAGVENDTGSRLSTPVDENTLHFGRGKRSCAERARDAIRDRLA